MCRLLFVVVACLGMIGCDAETLGYVKKAKYDTLQKQLEKAEANLKAARQQALGCQGHKYQIYNEGFRTWQLDLVTGEKCILLTNEDDLKKPKTRMQVCNE
jgi:Tfp pilus assembly protein PilV